MDYSLTVKPSTEFEGAKPRYCEFTMARNDQKAIEHSEQLAPTVQFVDPITQTTCIGVPVVLEEWGEYADESSIVKEW